MSKLYIVCVIYNIGIEDIASIDSFKRIASNTNDIKIIVMDNSDNQAIQKKNVENSNNNREIIYISNEGNIGISKSFNKAVSQIENRDSWIMFSDDDTNISYSYLMNLYNTIISTKNEIVSGIVYSGSKPMSPIKRIKLFNDKDNFIYTAGIYSDIYCINSCLCVKRSLFDTVRYNEEIFLDSADFMFMDALIGKQLNKVEIIEGDINQAFSGNTRVYIDNALKRYQIYKNDFKKYCKATGKSCMFMYSMLLKHLLKIIMTSRYFKREK